MPPIVNSSNKLSPIGNSSLYKPLAVKSCARLAKTSWPPSNAPDWAADLSLLIISSFVPLSLILRVFLSMFAIGAISVRPITPPVRVANVSDTGPTSSPISLAICILSTCWAIPLGTAKAAGNPYIPADWLMTPLLANALPAKPAPKKGIKEPTPSASLVE